MESPEIIPPRHCMIHNHAHPIFSTRDGINSPQTDWGEHMELFVITLTTGLCVGIIYGLVGLSFTAIFNVSKVINFSQGSLAMLGAFVGHLLVFNAKVPLPLGIVLCMAIPAICGMGVNQFFAEPLLKRHVSEVTIFLATLAGALIIEGLIGGYTSFAYFKTKLVFGKEPITLGMVMISRQYVAIIIAAAVLCSGYWFLLNKTKIGLGIKATGIDPDMASLAGIRLSRIRMVAWIVSAGITGVAGFLVAPLIYATPLMGLPTVVDGFIAAIVGGFGNPLAAMLGGVILGLLRQFFTGYVSAGLGDLFVFIALLITLAFRPHGIIRVR